MGSNGEHPMIRKKYYAGNQTCLEKAWDLVDHAAIRRQDAQSLHLSLQLDEGRIVLRWIEKVIEQRGYCDGDGTVPEESTVYSKNDAQRQHSAALEKGTASRAAKNVRTCSCSCSGWAAAAAVDRALPDGDGRGCKEQQGNQE